MRFRHYKGGEYEFVTLAFRETPNFEVASVGQTPIPIFDAMVVYRSIETGVTWTRPAAEFFGRMHEEFPGVHYPPLRFTPLVPPKAV